MRSYCAGPHYLINNVRVVGKTKSFDWLNVYLCLFKREGGSKSRFEYNFCIPVLVNKFLLLGRFSLRNQAFQAMHSKAITRSHMVTCRNRILFKKNKPKNAFVCALVSRNALD